MIYDPPSATLQEDIGTYLSNEQTTFTVSQSLVEQQPLVPIQKVECSPSPSDLILNWTSSSFTFSSRFGDVVERKVRYSIRGDKINTWHMVPKKEDLPSQYDPHHIIPPPASIPITFIITYPPVYNPVTQKNEDVIDTWALTLEVSTEKTMQYIKDVVNGGQGKQGYKAARQNKDSLVDLEPEQFYVDHPF